MPKVSKTTAEATDIGVGRVYEQVTADHEIAIPPAVPSSRGGRGRLRRR